MSLHKENTPACSHERLVVTCGEQKTFPLTVVELSDQDLQKVMGADGPSGLQFFHRRNRPGRCHTPAGAGRPGLRTGPGFPWFPDLPPGWGGSDGPGSFTPDYEDDLGGF